MGQFGEFTGRKSATLGSSRATAQTASAPLVAWLPHAAVGLLDHDRSIFWTFARKAGELCLQEFRVGSLTLRGVRSMSQVAAAPGATDLQAELSRLYAESGDPEVFSRSLLSFLDELGRKVK